MSKYYIIPKGSEKPFQKVLLKWHTGIDAVAIENGDFILSEKSYNMVSEKYPDRKITVNEISVNLSNEIEKYPVVEEKDVVFKTYETIEEPIKDIKTL